MKITLTEWAARNYSVPISPWVLGKWRREGQIYPPPERVWPNWMVEPNAKRIVEGAGYVPLTERIKRAA
jgi:hypothetical protein